MRVLVVNAGSSSLRLSVVVEGVREQQRELERWDGAGEQEAVQELLAGTGPVDAVGHRGVHGGADRTGPALVDDAVLAELAALLDLAPLHQPRAVVGIASLRGLLPGVPSVACFDTAFHAGLPAAAATYALPAEWNARWRLRRYDFHGLSHAHAARRAATLLDRPLADLRLVTCHLGAGASLCAVVGGRSVDTTMGFTPAEGLVMRTRSGSVDPGLLLWLLQSGGVGVDELAEVLANRSGLAGLSGTSGDLRDVRAAAAGGSADAQLAYDVFVHRLAREAGGMVVAAGGLDALVLTGGIGEHAPDVRRDLVARLTPFGAAIDRGRNERAQGDADISAPSAAVRTLVVPAQEDLQVASEVEALLGGR
ncbi:acetate/propionate family kinase [soil metagenome]